MVRRRAVHGYFRKAVGVNLIDAQLGSVGPGRPHQREHDSQCDTACPNGFSHESPVSA